MRYRLIHAYFGVDLDIVWQTINNDLPPLIATLNDISRRREDGDRKDAP